MSDAVISALIGCAGIALGSLITILGLFCQSLFQFHKERKQHIMRKREELYLKACEVLMEHDKYCSQHNFNKYCKEKFNEIQAMMLIYASRKIYDAYYTLDGEIISSYNGITTKKKIEKIGSRNADKVEAFASKMRKELKLKDRF